MDKKLQVFVSSTYEDLKDERQKAVEAILDAGHIPAGMELFKAGKSQMKTIRKWIDDSDVYMLILGGRYGSIEKESGLSYTELEYRYALKTGMPVFPIVLSKSFLYAKAADPKVTTDIFEKDHEELYNNFKLFVENKTIVKHPENIDQISAIIASQLNSILYDTEYNLIGWVKSNAAPLNTNPKNYSDSQLRSINNNTFYELISRNYPLHSQDFLSQFAQIPNDLLNYEGLLNSYKRETNLYLINHKELKVETTTVYNYEYLLDKHFKKSFFATKQQANSFQMEKLLINDTDYTKQFEKTIEYQENRGQFQYKVRGKTLFPIDSLPATILEISSYICHPLDFIQKAEPHFPCKNFNVTVKLHNDIKNQYSIIGMVFSQFSKNHADDYKSNQMRNTETYYTMQLPEWSLPGSGYMVILKNKN